MSKLAWVMLPLLLAAAWLAGLALRRRLPSPVALNVWSSVLLLVYLLGTAGLGIFWVANQQLPVFDWHYLFGYTTVLLVAVHLAFNFRIVWRHWLRPKPAVAQTASAVQPSRRSALGLLSVLGAVAAGGAAFVIGLRHGRTELHVGPAAARASGAALPGGAGAAAQDMALAVVEQFHEFSAHSRAGVFRRAPGADWGDPPPPFKAYPGAPRLALPPAGAPAQAPDLDIAALGRVLWHSAGVSEKRGTVHFRTAPSSGALFATELYVVVRDVPGIEPGLWHYDGRLHLLRRLASAAPTSAALGLPGRSDAPGSEPPAQVVASAIFRRSGHKYRDRTYRYVLADLGHALENLRVAAAASGLDASFARQFDESRVAAALQVDEAEEGVLALASLRAATGPVRPDLPAAVVPAQWQAAALAGPGGGVLGVTDAIHRATSLRADGAPGARGHAASSAASAAPGDGWALPAPAPRAVAPAELLQVIARRRSIRRYAELALPLAALSEVLDAMARRQAPVFSSALRIDVVAHAVQGLPPGAWRYEPQGHRLLPRRLGRALRAQARSAALDQDVIGDAAVVFVISLDRAALAADPAGAARGYRHAFLEAGLVGERLYLQAGVLGLGVCAVGAFYDDQASALVGLNPAREWVLHFAALGVPA